MGQRPYLRELTQLSRPLVATVVLGALAALLWAVAVMLDQIWDVDVDVLPPVLGALMIGVVICAGVELTRNRSRWVRGIGVFLIVAAVLAVLLVLLLIWYVSLLCGDGCN